MKLLINLLISFIFLHTSLHATIFIYEGNCHNTHTQTIQPAQLVINLTKEMPTEAQLYFADKDQWKEYTFTDSFQFNPSRFTFKNSTVTLEGSFATKVSEDPMHRFGNGDTPLKFEVIKQALLTYKHSEFLNTMFYFYLSAQSTAPTIASIGQMNQKAMRIYRAIISKNAPLFLSLLSFPLRVNRNGEHSTIKSIEEAKKFLNSLLTPSLIENIKHSIAHNVPVTQGNYMLANGAVWFNKEGKIIALNL